MPVQRLVGWEEFARSMMVRTKNSNKQGQWQASYWVRQKLLSSRATQVWSCWGRFWLRNCSNIGPGITDCSQSNQARSRTETCGKILNNCCNCSTMRGTITAKKPMMRASNTTTVMAMAISLAEVFARLGLRLLTRLLLQNSKTICRICQM